MKEMEATGMDFANFAKCGKHMATVRAWVVEPGLCLYVRKPLEGLRPPGVDFDLADCTATEPGQGALTAFLDRYEPSFGFYFENIINDRLIVYLSKRGYRYLLPPCAGRSVCMFRERGERCDGLDLLDASSASTTR